MDLFLEEFSSLVSGFLTLSFWNCLSDVRPLPPAPYPDPDPRYLQCEYNQPSGLWQLWLSVFSSPAILGDLGCPPLPVVLVPSTMIQLPPPDLALGSPGSSRLGSRTARLQDVFVTRPSFLRPSDVSAA